MIIRQSGTLAQRTLIPYGWWTSRYYATDNGKTYLSKGAGAWVDVSTTPPESNDVSGYLSGTLAQRPSPDSVLGYIFTDTATGNSYEAFPGVWVAVPAAGGGASLANTITLAPGSGNIAAALSGAGPNTGILLGVGAYVEDAGFSMPDDVHIIGLGRELSIIQSALNSNGGKSIVALGNNSLLQNLAVIGTAAIPTHQSCIGPHLNDRTFTKAVLRNVRMKAESDVIYTEKNCGDLTCWNCRFESSYDAIGWGYSATPGELTLFGCEVVITGGDTWNDNHYGIYAKNRLSMYGGLISVNGAYYQNEGLVMDTAGIYVRMHGVALDIGAPGVGGGTSWDVDNFGGVATNAILDGCYRIDGTPLLVNGRITKHLGVNKPAATVATLPSSPTLGQIETVTDGAAALAWGATVTGAGTAKYLVMWNGTNWTVVGK